MGYINCIICNMKLENFMEKESGICDNCVEEEYIEDLF